jgi:hypothetical protein
MKKSLLASVILFAACVGLSARAADMPVKANDHACDQPTQPDI